MDGRAYSLQITETGQASLEENRQVRQEMIEQLLKGWSEEEGHLFGELLQKFNATFLEEG